jgi:predicted nucleic acid-binding protein
MNKIVIDTNIVFSTLLNTDSRIGQILINGHFYFDFYAPANVRTEIFEHREKIVQLTGITENEFLELYELVIRNIKILNHTLIPLRIYHKAEKPCKSVDPNDTVLIAVTEFVNGRLWTGDRKLINGLTAKGYINLIQTDELYHDFIKKGKAGRKL